MFSYIMFSLFPSKESFVVENIPTLMSQKYLMLDRCKWEFGVLAFRVLKAYPCGKEVEVSTYRRKRFLVAS